MQLAQMLPHTHLKTCNSLKYLLLLSNVGSSFNDTLFFSIVCWSRSPEAGQLLVEVCLPSSVAPRQLRYSLEWRGLRICTKK